MGRIERLEEEITELHQKFERTREEIRSLIAQQKLWKNHEGSEKFAELHSYADQMFVKENRLHRLKELQQQKD